MRVAVIGGTGYVGLVTGIGLAQLGHRVFCADIDSTAINSLSRGDAPIREQGLEKALRRVLKRRRISFTTDIVQASADADVVLVAVGTPSAEDGRADMSQVFSAADRVALGIRISGHDERSRDRPKVVAMKSTVPVGTCEALRDRILAGLSGEKIDFDVVSNPEFLREGSAFRDFMNPDRIVIGAYRKRAAAVMKRLYKRLEAPFVVTDPRSSEMVKYACNSYLASRVSFINEIAGIAQAVGADIRKVAEGMGLDPRIGRSYLEPGMGFGGPCLGKDIRSLIAFGSDAGAGTALLRAVLERNGSQMEEATEALRRLVGGLAGRKFAILGLSFKAGTADTRDSPSLSLVARLSREGAQAAAWDPLLSASAESLRSFPYLREKLRDAARGADCLVVMTDGIDLGPAELEELAVIMARPAIFDTRRRLSVKNVLDAGFAYQALGVSPRRIPHQFKKNSGGRSGAAGNALLSTGAAIAL